MANPVFLRAAVVLFLLDVRVFAGCDLHARATEETSEERDFSATPTPSLETLPPCTLARRQDPGTGRAEARIASAIEGRATSGADQRESQPGGAFESLLRRAGARNERLVKTSNAAAKAILGFRFHHRNGRARYLPRRRRRLGEAVCSRMKPKRNQRVWRMRLVLCCGETQSGGMLKHDTRRRRGRSGLSPSRFLRRCMAVIDFASVTLARA